MHTITVVNYEINHKLFRKNVFIGLSHILRKKIAQVNDLFQLLKCEYLLVSLLRLLLVERKTRQ